MKSYDYECPSCGHKQSGLFLLSEVEKNDHENQKCKKCGEPTKRVRFYASPGVNLPNNPGTFKVD